MMDGTVLRKYNSEVTPLRHGIDTPWFADASVFPRRPAVGAGLTLIADALRLAKEVLERLWFCM